MPAACRGRTTFVRWSRPRPAGSPTRRTLWPGGARPTGRGVSRSLNTSPRTFFGAGQRPVFCTGPIHYIGAAAVRADIETFRAALEGVPVDEAFLLAVAPGTIEHWLRNEYYPSDEAYLYAIADAVHEEYEAIRRAPTGRAESRAADDSARSRAFPHVLGELPRPTPLRHPAARHRRPRHQGARRRVFHRSFESLKLPPGKILVPGVVGHYSDFIEHPELVAERLVTYARLVGRENVIAGTDCGRGTRVGHPSITWAMFQAMAEGARLATKQLWGS